MKYLHTDVDFFNPFGHDILKGFVTKDNGVMLTVEIRHGQHHGEVWEISYEDVLEDYEEAEDEQFYKWYSEE